MYGARASFKFRARGPIRGVLSPVESVASIFYSYARKFLHLNEILIFPRRRLTVGTFAPAWANFLMFWVLGDASSPIKNSSGPFAGLLAAFLMERIMSLASSSFSDVFLAFFLGAAIGFSMMFTSSSFPLFSPDFSGSVSTGGLFFWRRLFAFSYFTKCFLSWLT